MDFCYFYLLFDSSCMNTNVVSACCSLPQFDLGCRTHHVEYSPRATLSMHFEEKSCMPLTHRTSRTALPSSETYRRARIDSMVPERRFKNCIGHHQPPPLILNSNIMTTSHQTTKKFHGRQHHKSSLNSSAT